jgi:hypothetical protein
MTIAPCPHCGKPCDCQYVMLNGSMIRMDGWQALCTACGYSGPVAAKMEDAARWHNKISQNCGACNGAVGG